MKKVFVGIMMSGLVIAFGFSDACMAVGQIQGEFVVVQGTSLTAYALGDQSILWSVNTGISNAGCIIIPDGGNSAVVLAQGSGQTRAYDVQTGQFLWSKAGGCALLRANVYNQIYNNPICYPYGTPKMNSNTIVPISNSSSSLSTTQLVNCRTGQVYWTRTDNFEAYATQFLPIPSDSYDVIFSSGPPFTGTGGQLFRVDGATGQTKIWYRQFSNRCGISVPDVTGDGQYDFFAQPSAWSDDVQMINGTTGATIWHKSYGSFDVIGHPEIVQGANGYDVITSAQLSSGGGIRRYQVDNGNVIWDSLAMYNDNTIRGLIKRAGGGLTILSGWRHQGKMIALDAATGNALWDNVPLYDSDSGAVGVPDVTGDGSEDVLSISGGYLRLYNGVTGSLQSWFTAIPADSLAYWNGSLSILAPNGGEDWIVGTTKAISWETCDDANITHVKIELSDSNSLAWQVINPNTPNDGEYDWIVPALTSSKCLIRISDVSNPNVSDTSDGVFSIYECRLQLPGDLNNDCYVNLADLAILAQNWMLCSNPLDENCNTFTEVAFIPTVYGPSGRIHGIILSPDESSLFAAYWADTSADPVQQFSLTDYSMINTMSYGRCHWDAGVSANGRYVFVSSYYQGNVSRFDLQNNNQRTDLSANYSWPALVATTQDRQKLIALGGRDGRSYDMNNDGISIYDISGDNFALLGTVWLPDEPAGYGMAFSPDNNYVYVVTRAIKSAKPKLYEISISGTYQITRSIALDSVTLGSVALVGNDIYVADNTNSKLLVVDKAGAFTSVKNTYNLESAPGPIKLHPNGRDLYILMPNINKLVVWDTTNKIIYGRYDQLNDGSSDIEFGSDGRIFIPNSSVTNNGIKVLR